METLPQKLIRDLVSALKHLDPHPIYAGAPSSDSHCLLTPTRQARRSGLELLLRFSKLKRRPLVKGKAASLTKEMQKVQAGRREHISDFNAVQISCEMDLNSHSWNWHVLLQISICCPASSSGQAAYNSKRTIVILSHFRNVQFEIRVGGEGGRGWRRLKLKPR